MSKLSLTTRKEILDALADFARKGEAANQDDAEFWRHYLVVPKHLKAFDQDNVLILGERGAGKSQLFQAMVKRSGREHLAGQLAKIRLPQGDIQWIPGYEGEGKSFADHRNLRDALAVSGFSQEENAMDLWTGYLVRVMPPEVFSPQENARIQALRNLPGSAAVRILEAVRSLRGDLTTILDAVDDRLEQESKTLIIAYDELDRLGGFDYSLMSAALRGLIGFWAHYYKRWGRIRGKIFVRTDLFRQYAAFLGPDLAKLAANRVEITWDDDDLRLLLVKRLVNTHQFFVSTARALRCLLIDEKAGYTPSLARPAGAWKPFIETIISPFMGANRNKGHTWTWVLNHVRDGKKMAVPRPFLLLFEKAAARQDPEAPMADRQILQHTAIRAALDDVSAEEVNKAKEFPWLAGLKDRLQGLQVPIERKELLDKIRRRWTTNWADQADVPKPPAKNADDFIDVLIAWGIFSQRTNGKIDVPDLYRTGLGLKRKGGVRLA